MSGVCRKLAKGIRGMLRVHWELAELSRDCREFTRSSSKVIGSWPRMVGGSPKDDRDSPGVRRRLPRRSSGVGEVT
ncbi:hypothetical protein BHM03_00041237 [Ensete ventricosum]|nr:hypothetical protein BHM03_00041237 [Ensete ventricosum]